MKTFPELSLGPEEIPTELTVIGYKPSIDAMKEHEAKPSVHCVVVDYDQSLQQLQDAVVSSWKDLLRPLYTTAINEQQAAYDYCSTSDYRCSVLNEVWDELDKACVRETLKDELPGTKSTNPKEALGDDKLPLHLWPSTATAYGSVGMANGLCKYGRANYRVMGVKASTYVSATMRHLTAWFEGEWCDADDDVPHLAAALSCIAIIVDAFEAGKLIDDRMYPGGYKDCVKKLTPHITRLRKLHEKRNPKHYDVRDSENNDNV